MEISELMLPRYKVIADYPAAMHRVGDIIKTYETAMSYAVMVNDYGEKVCLADYPALFKRLEWWEERKIEDMPEYVKYSRSKYSAYRYFKIQKHMISSFGVFNPKGFVNEDNFFSYGKSIPITKEEYESKLNQTI